MNVQCEANVLTDLAMTFISTLFRASVSVMNFHSSQYSIIMYSSLVVTGNSFLPF